MPDQKALGEFLVEMGYIDVYQLDSALQEQRSSGRRLGKILIDAGLVSEEHLVHTLSTHFSIEVCDPVNTPIPQRVRSMISAAVANHYGVIPMGTRREESLQLLFIATSDPLNQVALEEVRAQIGAGLHLVWLITGDTALDSALTRYYGPDSPTGHSLTPAEGLPWPAPQAASGGSGARVIQGVPLLAPRVQSGIARPPSPSANASSEDEMEFPEESGAFEVVPIADVLPQLDVRSRTPSSTMPAGLGSSTPTHAPAPTPAQLPAHAAQVQPAHAAQVPVAPAMSQAPPLVAPPVSGPPPPVPSSPGISGLYAESLSHPSGHAQQPYAPVAPMTSGAGGPSANGAPPAPAYVPTARQSSIPTAPSSFGLGGPVTHDLALFAPGPEARRRIEEASGVIPVTQDPVAMLVPEVVLDPEPLDARSDVPDPRLEEAQPIELVELSSVAEPAPPDALHLADVETERPGAVAISSAELGSDGLSRRGWAPPVRDPATSGILASSESPTDPRRSSSDLVPAETGTPPSPLEALEPVETLEPVEPVETLEAEPASRPQPPRQTSMPNFTMTSWGDLVPSIDLMLTDPLAPGGPRVPARSAAELMPPPVPLPQEAVPAAKPAPSLSFASHDQEALLAAAHAVAEVEAALRSTDLPLAVSDSDVVVAESIDVPPVAARGPRDPDFDLAIEEASDDDIEEISSHDVAEVREAGAPAADGARRRSVSVVQMDLSGIPPEPPPVAEEDTPWASTTPVDAAVAVENEAIAELPPFGASRVATASAPPPPAPPSEPNFEELIRKARIIAEPGALEAELEAPSEPEPIGVAAVSSAVERFIAGEALDPETTLLVMRVIAAVCAQEGLLEGTRLTRALASLNPVKL